MKEKHTIIICGGHITPAIALIDALRAKNTIAIVFTGRASAVEGSRIPSFEYQLIKEKGIRFYAIAAGRLQRQCTWQTIPSLVKIPVGFIQACFVCLRERPSLIVSFGGYVALPVALAGWLFRIPVITHEQTMVPGLANKIIARLAKRVCVTYAETLTQFPKDKAVYTGLPLRTELFAPSGKSPYAFDIAHYPLVYITGGGTGSQSLNRLIFPILPNLLRRYSIVHQVGDMSQKEARHIRLTLPDEYKERYIAEPNISIGTVSWVLAHASLIIGRSGANTVMELAALGKAALFVPLPWSGGGEQQANAAWLASRGGAIVLTQQSLTPHLLHEKIDEAWGQIGVLQSRAKALAPLIARDGTKRFVREIEHILDRAA